MIRLQRFWFAAALAAAFAAPAAAQTPACGSRDAIVAQLAERYGEERRAVGLASSGVLMELLVGPTGGWTMLASRADGVSCIMATGEHLQFEAPGTTPPGANPS